MQLDKREIPPVLWDYLQYHQSILNHSGETITEYYLDIRLFLRYLLKAREMVSTSTAIEDIPIDKVDLPLLRSVTRTDIHHYLAYLRKEREVHPTSQGSRHIGLSQSSYARKESSLRSFFRYLYAKAELIDNDPMKSIPSALVHLQDKRILTEYEAVKLLRAVDGPHKIRDYCILILLLNCGLRISEVQGLNVADLGEDDSITIRKDAGTHRTIYLNDACISALKAWMSMRNGKTEEGETALFLSQKEHRISADAIQALVKKYLILADLDPTAFSPSSLRCTAANLMAENGVDLQTLQAFLGHKTISATMRCAKRKTESLRNAAQANPLGNIQSEITNDSGNDL